MINYRGHKRPVEERFWERVTITRDGNCWLFSRPDTSTGYGRIGVKSGDKWVQEYAHRFSYKLAKGPIAEGKEVDHICHTRNCVNPDHLELVTKEENLRRGRVWKQDHPGEKPFELPVKQFKINSLECHNGHPYKKGTWRINLNGMKDCIICNREYTRNSKIRLDPNRGKPSGHELNAKKTHCPYGHEYTEENTYINDGSRFCKACAKTKYEANKAEYNARAVQKRQLSKAEKLGLTMEDYLKRYGPNRTQCRKGHELTPENTWNGTRCKMCLQINNHNSYLASK